MHLEIYHYLNSVIKQALGLEDIHLENSSQ